MGKIVLAYVVIVAFFIAMGIPKGWALAIPVIGIVAIGAIAICTQHQDRRSDSSTFYAERLSSPRDLAPKPIVEKRINNNEPVKSFVAIDFETATGSRDSACAMAIVTVFNSEIVATTSFLFQPPDNKYNPINSRIHGMFPETTKQEPTIQVYYDEIFSALNNATVVAHNASFDMSVLNASFEYYGLRPPVPASVYCTYEMTGNKLNICCDEYGIDLNHHDPLSDARACALLYIHLQDLGVEGGVVRDRKKKANPQRKLQRACISNDQVSNKDTVFYGKNVVITGVFKDYDRVEIANTVQNFGASVKSAITKKTDILICGGGCGPAKLAKVQELKEMGLKEIKIIREKDLKRIM